MINEGYCLLGFIVLISPGLWLIFKEIQQYCQHKVQSRSMLSLMMMMEERSGFRHFFFPFFFFKPIDSNDNYNHIITTTTTTTTTITSTNNNNTINTATNNNNNNNKNNKNNLNNTTLLNIIGWCIGLNIFYIICRMVVLRFFFRHNYKTYAMHLEDMYNLTLRSCILYYCGNISEKLYIRHRYNIDNKKQGQGQGQVHVQDHEQEQKEEMENTKNINNNDKKEEINGDYNNNNNNNNISMNDLLSSLYIHYSWNYRYYILILYNLLLYTFTFEVCPRHIQLSKDFQASISAVIVLLVVFGVIFYTIFRNIYGHIQYGNGILYGILLLGIIGYLILVKYLCTIENNKFHMHHAIWAWLLALILRYKCDSSIYFQTCAIATYIHGISTFGCESLVEFIPLQPFTVDPPY